MCQNVQIHITGETKDCKPIGIISCPNCGSLNIKRKENNGCGCGCVTMIIVFVGLFLLFQSVTNFALITEFIASVVAAWLVDIMINKNNVDETKFWKCSCADCTKDFCIDKPDGSVIITNIIADKNDKLGNYKEIEDSIFKLGLLEFLLHNKK